MEAWLWLAPNPRPQNMATRISFFSLLLFILVSYTSGLLNPRSPTKFPGRNSESSYEYQTLYIGQPVSCLGNENGKPSNHAHFHFRSIILISSQMSHFLSVICSTMHTGTKTMVARYSFIAEMKETLLGLLIIRLVDWPHPQSTLILNELLGCILG